MSKAAQDRWRSKTDIGTVAPLASGRTEFGTAKGSSQMAPKTSAEILGNPAFLWYNRTIKMLKQRICQTGSSSTKTRSESWNSTSGSWRSRLISCPVNFMEQSLKRHPPLILRDRCHFLMRRNILQTLMQKNQNWLGLKNISAKENMPASANNWLKIFRAVKYFTP